MKYVKFEGESAPYLTAGRPYQITSKLGKMAIITCDNRKPAMINFRSDCPHLLGRNAWVYCDKEGNV